ncbi:hypothetical protein Ate02nite_32990 [Paractinoplanes tereljensis]|uniref:Galactose oxidase n=1 Tax=Paractinoplanes tereljensis TaxID=571912 RepID=A0A919TST8_9ACTN|nr:hypothetical protein Ate02nite_32990 [Actinoplanes tereljensis]
MHLARGGLDVVAVDGGIFVMGGFDPAKPAFFDSVEMRRTGGVGTWHDVAPMPTARTNPAAAVLGGKIYVAGGVTNDDTDSDVVEVYDPRSGRWSTSTRMPFARSAGAAAVLDGVLYVAGGGLGDETLASVVAYDPAARRWRTVAPMPTARWALRLVASNGHLYAIGGRSTEENSLATVERYDPKANTWTTVAPMHNTRAVPGVVAVDRGNDHFIVVVAGCPVANGVVGDFFTTTEVFNVKTGRWRVLPAQLPRGRCSLGSALEADGSVLAISGGVKINGVITATPEVEALRL